jgi:hypothetical protein
MGIEKGNFGLLFSNRKKTSQEKKSHVGVFSVTILGIRILDHIKMSLWNGTVGNNEVDWMYALAKRQQALELKWQQRLEIHTWWKHAPKEIISHIYHFWILVKIVEKNKRLFHHVPGYYKIQGGRLLIK